MRMNYALLALFVALVFISGCISSGANEQPGAQQGGETNAVAIRNFAFVPEIINVAAGTTVTWTNEDSSVHTVKSDTFNSGNINKGESFQHTFSSAGTYDYTCGIHPSMKGKVIVK